MDSDFTLSVTKLNDETRIVCSGELDAFGASKFLDAVEVALRYEDERLTIDGRGINLLASAGITALGRALDLCRSADVEFDLEVGSHARRILDLVGLWWLGVVDDGGEIEAMLQQAIARYAELYDTDGLQSI